MQLIRHAIREPAERGAKEALEHWNEVRLSSCGSNSQRAIQLRINTAHLRRKYGFGGIIPLRSNPSSVNIKESMYAADFARSAPKPVLFPKLGLFASHLFRRLVFNFSFNQSATTFTRIDAG
jgi:hypothetical protein